MYISSYRVSESFLRRRLEFCYEQRLLEEAVLIGNILDKMQSFLFKKERDKDSGRKTAYDTQDGSYVIHVIHGIHGIHETVPCAITISE